MNLLYHLWKELLLYGFFLFNPFILTLTVNKSYNRKIFISNCYKHNLSQKVKKKLLLFSLDNKFIDIFIAIYGISLIF